MPDRSAMFECWVVRAAWAASLGLNLVYGAIAVLSTGAEIRSLAFRWPSTNDSFELGVTLLGAFGLLHFIYLSRKKVMRRPFQGGRTRTLAVVAIRWLVRWAPLSGVTLCGLVLVFHSHDAGKLLPFILAAIFCFAISFPSRRQLEELRPQSAS